MIFCRGCGKELHESAVNCPHCGASQSSASADLGKKNSKARKPMWVKILIVIFALLAFVIAKSSYQGYKREHPGTGTATAQSDEFAELAAATPAQLSPTGELAAMFNLMSENTDLQRKNKLKEIKGKIIEWTLPVYEVRQAGSGYAVQTEADQTVGAIVYITARNEQDKALIESFKTGSRISFKGVIKDVSMRHLEIKPAILFQPGSAKPVAIEVQQTVPVAQPSQDISHNLGLYEWKSGWGQGVTEYSAEDGNGNQLSIACSDNEAVSAIAKIGGAWYSSKDEKFDVIVDGETYSNPFNTDCRVCANNFEPFWMALRKANNIKVSAAGKSAVIPTKNISKILPAFSSKENSCRVAQ
jgi:hypothetical protein